MRNRLLAIAYNNQDCLVHLRFDNEQMQVRLLDKVLRDDFHTDHFTVTNKGALLVDAKQDIRVNVKALEELYKLMLHECEEEMHRMVA
jgi:hypothetical protein